MENAMKNLLIHEWKGIAILAAFGVLAATFIATAVSPPWNERVLQAIAEQPDTVRPQPQPHPHLAQR
jgi:hypothetical protein